MSERLPPNYTQLLAQRLSSLPEVRLAYLFGSRANGRARSDSDLDVAVLVNKEGAAGASRVKQTLRLLAGRLSGEIPSTLLDIVLLNHAPALLRHRVVRDGLVLFARDEVERVRFESQTIREYCDMEPMLAEHRRRRIARLKTRRTRVGGSGDILKAARSLQHLS